MNEILVYFFEAYFHQDWRDDYSTSLDAVKAFSMDEPMETKLKLRAALLELLDQNELSQDGFNKLGGNFKPETEGMSVKYWIEQTINIID